MKILVYDTAYLNRLLDANFSMSMAQPARYGRNWKRKQGGICNEVRRNAHGNVGAVCRLF